jgi:hypothetical protein
MGLIDSGASVCCMSISLFNKISPEFIIDKIPHSPIVEVETAGKGKIAVKGVYVFTFSLPNLGQVQWPVAVLDGDLAWNFFLGYDFLKAFHAVIHCSNNTVSFSRNADTSMSACKLYARKSMHLPPRASRTVRIRVNTTQHACLISSPHSAVVEGLCEVGGGFVKLLLINPFFNDIKIPRNSPLGFAIPIDAEQLVRKHELHAVNTQGSVLPNRTLSAEKRAQLWEVCLKSALSKDEKEALFAVLIQHHEAFADNDDDIGRTDAVPHRVYQKEQTPVYRKQFPLPQAHTDFMHKTIDHLLRLGCVRRDYSSPHNSPVFAVQKPHSTELRLVQDLRQINESLHNDFNSFMSVHECLDRLGGLQANYISSLDFLHAYWQLSLHPRSQPLTAFTIPGKGKFVWTVSPMGLKSSPSAFTRLMDFVFQELHNTVIYLDDVLVGSRSFPEHLNHLAECFVRIRQNNLRLRIKKCFFAAQEIEYLGYTVSNKGIKPGLEKMAAIRNFPVPTTPKEVRRFCGIANYFRQFVPNFAELSGKLSCLTKKDADWKGGPLPADARAAFEYLKQKLCSAPILAFPAPNSTFQLYTDASLEGGFGAVLTQVQGNETRLIACASRTLKPHEKNYSAFLLEMAAAVFGIETFHVYLYDTPFTLLMDHRPLEPLGTVHKRTLNRLQQLMNQYTFQLQYRPGKQNAVADALSRAPVCALGQSAKDLRTLQLADPFCSAVLQALEKQRISSPELQRYVSKILRWCLLQDGVAYIQFPDVPGYVPSKPLFITPKQLRFELLRAAHSSRFAGHGGIEKTIRRLRVQYWWPSLAADVQSFVQSCPTCQNLKDPPLFHKRREPLQPLPAPDMPNVRVHVDLIVVPKKSSAGSKYILVMTCAFSKLVELVPLPSKDAITVASAIFTRWICRYSCPREIISDRGGEFINELLTQLCILLGVDHKKTSSYHPQANASCERFNRELEKILAALLVNPDDDWEQLLPIASLIYNTSVHQATKMTPFFLTYLHDPNLPYFELSSPRPLYGEDWATTAIQRLKLVYATAKNNIVQAGKVNEEFYNRRSDHFTFNTNDDVMIKFDRSTLKAQNKKFAKTWFHFKIVKRLTESTYLVQKVLPSGILGNTSIVHRNRIKPRFAAPTPVVPQNKIEKPAKSHSVPVPVVNTPPLVDRSLDRPVSPPASPVSSHSANSSSAPSESGESEHEQRDIQVPVRQPVVPQAQPAPPPPQHAPPRQQPPRPGRHDQQVADRLFRPLRSNSTAPPAGPPPSRPLEYAKPQHRGNDDGVAVISTGQSRRLFEDCPAPHDPGHHAGWVQRQHGAPDTAMPTDGRTSCLLQPENAARAQHHVQAVDAAGPMDPAHGRDHPSQLRRRQAVASLLRHPDQHHPAGGAAAQEADWNDRRWLSAGRRQSLWDVLPHVRGAPQRAYGPREPQAGARGARPVRPG